jgi:hypothetical protein
MRNARVAVGILIAVLGLGLCVGVDLYVAHTNDYDEFSLGGDLFVSLPLLILATLTLVGAISIPAGLIGLVALGAFIGFFYWDIQTSDSSTAALGYVVMPFYGLFGIALLWGGDALARAALRYLRRTRRPPVDATS